MKLSALLTTWTAIRPETKTPAERAYVEQFFQSIIKDALQLEEDLASAHDEIAAAREEIEALRQRLDEEIELLRLDPLLERSLLEQLDE